MVPPPSCSGGITSKVNSTPVSRVRVHKRHCNREKPRFILLKFLQFLNFPQLFRAKLEPAQYDYWTRGSDLWLKCTELFASFQNVQKGRPYSTEIQNFQNFQ